MGRPALDFAATQIRLPPEDRRRIEAIVGARGMAQFIREAVSEKLARIEAELDDDRGAPSPGM